MPSGPTHDPGRKHLFIVLNDLTDTQSDQLIVCANSYDENLPHDTSCYLYAGDHPFITRKSWVFYRGARVIPGQKILAGIRAGQLTQQLDLDPDIFERICHGVVMSEQTRQRILNFYCNNS